MAKETMMVFVNVFPMCVDSGEQHTHTHTTQVLWHTVLKQAFSVMAAASKTETICKKISHKTSRLGQMGPVSKRNMEMQLDQVAVFLSAHPLLYAVLIYVHMSVQRSGVLLHSTCKSCKSGPCSHVLAPPLPFPPIYSFLDSHMGHLSAFFFSPNLGSCGKLS